MVRQGLSQMQEGSEEVVHHCCCSKADQDLLPKHSWMWFFKDIKMSNQVDHF